jgi:hypothetical protein
LLREEQAAVRRSAVGLSAVANRVASDSPPPQADNDAAINGRVSSKTERMGFI